MADYLTLAQHPHLHKKALLEQIAAAARAAGYCHGPVFHGTHERVSITFQKRSYRTEGIYLSADERYAASYGSGNTIRSHVRINNPYVLNLPENWSYRGTIVLNERIVAASYRELSAESIATLQAAGYDGILANINGKLHGGPWKDDPRNPFEVVAFEPDQVKLGDAVLYDAAQQIIPLETRFPILS